MKKTFISICAIIILLLISSCRPSYMRCPKNRRCVATPMQNNDLFVAQVNITKNKQEAL